MFGPVVIVLDVVKRFADGAVIYSATRVDGAGEPRGEVGEGLTPSLALEDLFRLQPELEDGRQLAVGVVE